MKITSYRAFATALGLAALAPAIHAQLLNGSFSTGTLADWTTYGNLGDTFVTAFPDGGTPNSVALGAVGTLDYLYQDFATTPGDIYAVSFSYYALTNAPSQEFDALFGPASIVLPTVGGLTSYSGLTDLLTLGGPLNSETFTTTPSPDAWVNYSFDVVATSTTSQLLFASRQDPSYDHLTNIVVSDQGPSGMSPVPEPATYGWIAAGAMMAFAAWRMYRPTSKVGLFA
jgi:hypothetical protein